MDRRGPDLVGTVTSAVIGVVALLACLLVVLLTDDDVDLAGGSSPLGGGDPTAGGLGGSGGSDEEESGQGGGTSADPDSPVPAECTKTECPAVGPPTEPPGEFPYPPGTTAARWTDDFCPDSLPADTTVRQVRGSLTEVRDFYLANLLDAGYGWGLSTLTANPFTTDASGRKVPVGWVSSLTTNDPAVYGDLALESNVGPRTVCGPAPGVVYIQVRLP